MKSLKTQKQRIKNSCDHFSELPDDLILNILNRIDEAMYMCWFLLISKRFFNLIPNVRIQNLTLRLKRPPFAFNFPQKPIIKTLHDTFLLSLIPSLRCLKGKLNAYDVFLLDQAARGSLNVAFLDDCVFRNVIIYGQFLKPHFNFITNVHLQLPMEKPNIYLYPIVKWTAECWKRCSFTMIVMLAHNYGSLHTDLRNEFLPINVMGPWNIIFDTDLRIRYDVVGKFVRWFPNIRHAEVSDLENNGKLVVNEDYFNGMRNGEVVGRGFDFSHQHVHEEEVRLPEYQRIMTGVRVFLYKLNGEDIDDDMIVSNAFEGIFSKAVNTVWTEGVICKTISPSTENR